MSRLKLRLLILSIIGIFQFIAFYVDALPPDPQLHSAIRNARKYINLKPSYTADGIEECFTDSLNTLAMNWQHLPTIYQREFQGIFLRPGLPGSPFGSVYLPNKFETPHFRLHYTNMGRHAPPLEDINPMNGVPDYVDICADAIERSFHVEIELMGYKPPLDDFWALENGGNHKYDVYLFGFGALGVTVPEVVSGRILSTVVTTAPWFAINSRIYNFFGKSEGIRYIETTCAHEFFHGIQFAYNNLMPRWFMEASATWSESKVYDAGLIDDLDDIPDPDEIGETDAYNYYAFQLRRWFLLPDIALDSLLGDHEYGSVIFVFYMAERFDVDIVRQFYGGTTAGSFREYGNFSQVFENHGTTLVEAFKTFTEWNYFTYDRDDGKHYFNGHRFPPVAIHPSDVHHAYPVRMDFDSESMPGPFSSRYIVFEPPDGVVMDEFAVRIDGADLAPIDMNQLTAADLTAIQGELRRHDRTGLRGWGARFVVEKRDGTNEIREAFTYHRSQEGQITFKDFGGEIKKITLILINVRPDVERVVIPGGAYFGGSVNYRAGHPPAGKLSSPTVAQGASGGVLVQWGLEDLTDIREIVIVRKRFTSMIDTDEQQPFQSAAEVLNAADRDGNGIPDSDVNIVGRVNATDTRFEDMTVFQDLDVNSPRFDPQNTHYYYAIVPVNAIGLMGTPGIDPNGITPTFTPVNTTAAAPTHTRLFQSYPNPFNPDVWIPYELAEEAPVSIAIYNIVGQLVRILDLGVQSPGQYINKGTAAYWDGRTLSGERTSSGVYFYMLRAGGFVGTQKMVILK